MLVEAAGIAGGGARVCGEERTTLRKKNRGRRQVDRGAGAGNFPRTPRGRTKGCFLEYPLRSSEKNVELASSFTFLLEQSSWSLTCLASQVWSRARKAGVE